MSWRWLVCRECGRKYGKNIKYQDGSPHQVKSDRSDVCLNCFTERGVD